MLTQIVDVLLNGVGLLFFCVAWFFYVLVYVFNWPHTKRLSPPQLSDYTLP